MNLTIMYFGNLNEIHGINKVTESFLRGRELFEKENINLSYIYSRDHVLDCEETKTLPIGVGINKLDYKLRRRFINLLKNAIFNKFAIFEQIRINRAFIEPAINVVNKYVADNIQSDVIIYQDFFTAANHIRLSSDEKIKRVLVLHSGEEPLNQLKKVYPKAAKTKFFNRIEYELEYALKNVDEIVFVSKKPLKKFGSQYGEKINYVYNGIEDMAESIESKRGKSDKLQLINVGSITHIKGQDILLEALNSIDRKYLENIQLNLVGDGDYLPILKKYVEKNNLKDHVRFYGVRTDISDILSDMDIFISTSRDEGLPIAIIEAMRSGLPIIATNVGGIPEMMEDFNHSLLVNPDKDSIKQAIINVLCNKDKLVKIGQESRSVYESKFSLSAMISKYCTIINDN